MGLVRRAIRVLQVLLVRRVTRVLMVLMVLQALMARTGLLRIRKSKTSVARMERQHVLLGFRVLVVELFL